MISCSSPASQLSTAIVHSDELGDRLRRVPARDPERPAADRSRVSSAVSPGARVTVTTVRPSSVPDPGVRADRPGPAVDPVHGSRAGQGDLDLDRLAGLVEEVVQVQVQQVAVLAQVASARCGSRR